MSLVALLNSGDEDDYDDSQEIHSTSRESMQINRALLLSLMHLPSILLECALETDNHNNYYYYLAKIIDELRVK